MKPSTHWLKAVASVAAFTSLAFIPFSVGARDFVIGGSVVAAETGPVSFSLLANNPAKGLDPYFTTSVLYASKPGVTSPESVVVRSLFSSGNTVGNLYTLPGLDMATG